MKRIRLIYKLVVIYRGTFHVHTYLAFLEAASGAGAVDVYVRFQVPLLHLQFQQVWHGTTRCLASIAIRLVKFETAPVQIVDQRLAWLFIVVVTKQTSLNVASLTLTGIGHLGGLTHKLS